MKFEESMVGGIETVAGESNKESIAKDGLSEDTLMTLYHEFNTSRIDYNTVKWRTVQFITYLNGTFLTATVALLAYKNGNLNLYTKIILSILPLSVIVISYLGVLNFKHNSRLLWEQEASMFKIEKYLGFHSKILENKRWLKGDPYFVPLRNYDTVYRTCNLNEKTEFSIRREWDNIEQWLNFRWQTHKFRSFANWVFYIEAFVAIALVCVLFNS